MALFNFRPKTPQELEQEALEKAREQYQTLLGQPSVTAEQSRRTGLLMPQEGPVRPPEPTTGIPASTDLPPIPMTREGSGLLGGQVSPQEFFLKTAGMPGPMGGQALDVAKQGLLGGQTSPFSGSGIKAQAYNQAIKYNIAKQNKQPVSPQDEYAYNLAYQQLSTPSRYIDASGQQVEVPGMNMAGFATPQALTKAEPRKGVRRSMAGETAGKLAMINVAKSRVKEVGSNLFKEDGVNRDLVKEAWTWIDAPEGLPFGVGRPLAQFASPQAQKLYNAFEVGKQAITRVETGAAMPPQEVENTAKRFMPKPWDSDELIIQKWEGYNMFLDNIEKYLDPNNLTAEHTYNKVMEDIKKRQGAKTPKTTPKKKEKVVNWEDL